ncbi:MAG: phage tail protein [Litorilinea sp.]
MPEESVIPVRAADPLLAFMFSLEINDMTGYFTEVSGIISENEVITHYVVSANGAEITLQIPGRANGGEITLKRGMTQNVEFWEWRELVVNGRVAEARVDGSIVMYNRAYQEVRRWDFFNAWPSKLSGPSQIAADSNELAIEELTIMHEGLSLHHERTAQPLHLPSGAAIGADPDVPVEA